MAEYASGCACFGTDVTFACFSLKQYHNSMQPWLLTHCVLHVGECWVQRQYVGRLCSWGEVVKQVLQQDPDAVGREVEECIWYQQAGAAVAKESLCNNTLLKVCTRATT